MSCRVAQVTVLVTGKGVDGVAKQAAQAEGVSKVIVADDAVSRFSRLTRREMRCVCSSVRSTEEEWQNCARADSRDLV